MKRLAIFTVLAVLTIAPAAPTPGDWEGTTDQGERINLTVSGEYLTLIAITVWTNCAQFYLHGPGDPVAISNGHFEYDAYYITIVGDFSFLTANGTWDSLYYEPRLEQWCYGSGTWTAYHQSAHLQYLPLASR
jgi:hypothetical protein